MLKSMQPTVAASLFAVVLAVVLTAAAGCAEIGAPDPSDDRSCTDPAADADSDGVLDGVERCLQSLDTDGDGTPDYLDTDSDGDGLSDGQEDVNGDGLLGCCLQTCGKPGSSAQSICKLSADGCGAGQACVKGACQPARGFVCAQGETDRLRKDTFGDGVGDDKLGASICRDASEDNGSGRRTVKLHRSTTGDWHLALDAEVKLVELKLAASAAKQAAVTIDLDGSQREVAGFVVSRPAAATAVTSTGVTLQQELTKLIETLRAAVAPATLAADGAPLLVLLLLGLALLRGRHQSMKTVRSTSRR
jgi:hypothetical protein